MVHFKITQFKTNSYQINTKEKNLCCIVSVLQEYLDYFIMAEVEKVKAWLSTIGVSHLIAVFLDKDFNSLLVCSNLNDKDLDVLGITSPGVRYYF